MSFDIISATKRITDKYIRYLKTMYDINDPYYKKLFDIKMSDQSSFSKGPFLDVVDSFSMGPTVKQLIEEGTLSSDFQFIPSVYNKTLYKHQASSIEKLSKGRNIVVSTGTGSGKTESFLIPVINSLMKEREQKGKLCPGVRALLIYPMNALANDQISRLRSLLSEYPYITFGSYTGQTLETEEKALRKYHSLNNDQEPLENELISREKMKDAPPHILITNYSMLEYLMLRPEDNSFFQGDYADNWRFIVLDEAHTYSGSTGIEVSMLLRRLKAHLNNDELQYILTSATLGDNDSNGKVAEFARNLCCGEEFTESDIIRATRISLAEEKGNNINLSAEDYGAMEEILGRGCSDSKTLEMLTECLGITASSQDPAEYLYDVLICDETFWRVKNYMSRPRTVAELCSFMDWTETQVSSFVNVVSGAVKDRKKLFDSRYHMFIRACDGVYVTLGGHKDLSLTRQTTKYLENTEYKYYEILTCSQCHAIYLNGIVTKKGGRSFLRQRSGALGDTVAEAFLLGDIADDPEYDGSLSENDKQEIINYELCPHCGFIRESCKVNKGSCEHNEKDYVRLTRVKQSETTGRVVRCICCDGINNRGILRSFFSGQEAATSVIGTALFEELPDSVYHIEEPEPVDDGSGFDDDGFGDTEIRTIEAKAKQFLAFSDNRQAAAFFATYFSRTYQELLYSRVVYQNIKELDEGGMDIPSFAKKVGIDFKNNRIFDNATDETSPDYPTEGWKAVLRELVECSTRNSLIGSGLMKVDFSNEVRVPPYKANGKPIFTSQEVADICLILLKDLFSDNAISHGHPMSESDESFFTNNGHQGSYLPISDKKYIGSFLPKKENMTNKRIDYMERLFAKRAVEIDRTGVRGFLDQIWKVMVSRMKVLKTGSADQCYKVDVKQFIFVGSDNWYRCSKCRRITAYNVSDICPSYKCDGVLEKVNIPELEREDHYFRLYNDLDVRPLRVEEHTAQLSRDKAYDLQEKFKRHEIDVLSCSTTFEMGVDIGDLETVFMRNMPPTPSNYVQRAGRAGRSTRSAALALTFCNRSNHDFSFFNDPTNMITGKTKPPIFKVDNEKIGIRHLYSSAFAFFWRRYPHYFKRDGERGVSVLFGGETENDGYEKLKSYLSAKPEDLRDYLLKVFPDTLIKKYDIPNFGWLGWLFDEPDVSYPNLKRVYKQYRSEIHDLVEAKKNAEKNGKNNGAFVYRLKTYTTDSVISFLSRNNILPKYGFPVDTVDLDIPVTNNGSPSIELSRDLAMAISEYAPGCEVVAAKRLIKSRYIRREAQKGWRIYDYVKCENCKTLNISMQLDADGTSAFTECSHCGEPISKRDHSTFIIPEFGFTAETTLREPSLIKPDKTYRTEASMVAEGEAVYEAEYHVGALDVNIITMEDGEIGILNKSDFYVCSVCGYAEGQSEAKKYSSTIEKKHKRSSGHFCNNNILRKYSLGYTFKTDALSMDLNISMTHDEAFSVLQAIILSACDELDLDEREISGCLQYTNKAEGSTYDLILYDTTPGGAGHIKRIIGSDTMARVLDGAYRRARNCDCGGEHGDTSCYKCLRTYRNQQHHDIIKRQYVIDKLKGVLEPGHKQSVVTFIKKEKTSGHHVSLKLIESTASTMVRDASYEEIAELIAPDDPVLRGRIAEAMNENGIGKPDLDSVDLEIDGARGYYADLVWKMKKVLVFEAGNLDSYNAAKDSDHKCFYACPEFNIDNFISAIK